MLDKKNTTLLNFIKQHQPVGIADIHEGISLKMGLSTVRKYLKELVSDQYLTTEGNGKALRYLISDTYELLVPINTDTYYQLAMEDRNAKPTFNLGLITNVLPKVILFTTAELEELDQLHATYLKNISPLTVNEYKNELEKLAIDLSWKSGEIEGNTYTLLETEALIKYNEIAVGKKQEDARMLLNHKDAIDFLIAKPDFLTPLSVARIEDIHSILIKSLNVDRNIRKRGVSVGGTLYKPLSIESQIREALEQMCELINNKTTVIEKAFLGLILISYIQAFNDGNKRTARIVCNAILMEAGYCPITYRTVKASDYKKAMLLFYEQNNITALKQMFIEQYKFAVDTYFNFNA